MKILMILVSCVASIAMASPVIPAADQGNAHSTGQPSGPPATFFFTPFAGLPPTFNLGPSAPGVQSTVSASVPQAQPQLASLQSPQSFADLVSLQLFQRSAAGQPQPNAVSPQQQQPIVSQGPAMPVELAQAYADSNLRLAQAYREAELRLQAAKQKEHSETLLAQAIAGANAATAQAQPAPGSANSGATLGDGSSQASLLSSQQSSFVLPFHYPFSYVHNLSGPVPARAQR